MPDPFPILCSPGLATNMWLPLCISRNIVHRHGSRQDSSKIIRMCDRPHASGFEEGGNNCLANSEPSHHFTFAQSYCVCTPFHRVLLPHQYSITFAAISIRSPAAFPCAAYSRVNCGPPWPPSPGLVIAVLFYLLLYSLHDT